VYVGEWGLASVLAIDAKYSSNDDMEIHQST
jgi:hypothetical protein